MRITSGSCGRTVIHSKMQVHSGDRSKHKTHWRPFDRQHPPKWMKLGQTGLDDKRELVEEILVLVLIAPSQPMSTSPLRSWRHHRLDRLRAD